MNFRILLPSIIVLGLATLFFFPKPASNFLWYSLTALFFFVIIIWLLFLEKKQHNKKKKKTKEPKKADIKFKTNKT